MEETMNLEQPGLISELTQGKELAKQLLSHVISSSATHETNEVLIEKILSSYEKALKLLKWEADGIVTGNKSDSHSSFATGSPKSEVLDQDKKLKDVFKKRKIMAKWTEQVKICSGTGLEGSPYDGYSWRKYGQKEILGAKFPRAYYRCTHRNVQGCLATKQVQKSDEDPAVFEVTYKGRHTCTQASHLDKTSQPKRKMGLGENQFHNHQKNQPQQEKTEEKPQEKIFKFGAGLEVKIEDMENKEDIFPSFGFASPSMGSDNEDYNIFADTMMEIHFMENFSSPFISPSTSESNLFCLSPCRLGSTGFGQNVQTSESDLTDIISAPTSVTNSPIEDLDFLLDKEDFESNFPFETQNSLDNFSHFHQGS